MSDEKFSFDDEKHCLKSPKGEAPGSTTGSGSNSESSSRGSPPPSPPPQYSPVANNNTECSLPQSWVVMEGEKAEAVEKDSELLHKTLDHLVALEFCYFCNVIGDPVEIIGEQVVFDEDIDDMVADKFYDFVDQPATPPARTKVEELLVPKIDQLLVNWLDPDANFKIEPSGETRFERVVIRKFHLIITEKFFQVVDKPVWSYELDYFVRLIKGRIEYLINDSLEPYKEPSYLDNEGHRVASKVEKLGNESFNWLYPRSMILLDSREVEDMRRLENILEGIPSRRRE